MRIRGVLAILLGASLMSASAVFLAPGPEPTFLPTWTGPHLFVSSQLDNLIIRIDLDTLATKTIKTNIVRPEDGVCGPDGQLYFSQPDAHRIVRFDKDGNNEVEILTHDSIPPEGLSFDTNGNLYFNTPRKPTHSGVWRIPGAVPGAPPQNVLTWNGRFGEGTAFMKDGSLLATDAELGKVVKSPPPDFGTHSDFATNLNWPIGVTVRGDGDVFVAEGNSHRVLQYSSAGTFKGVVFEEQGFIPHFMEFDSEGNLYVAGGNANRVVKISPDGGATTIATLRYPIGVALCEAPVAPPVADAGPDQTVYEGYSVQFNGTGSRGSGSCKVSVETMNAKLPTPRFYTSAVWDGRYAHIFGGRDTSVEIDEILRYEPATDLVEKLSSVLPKAMRETSAIWNGSLGYVFGGYHHVMDYYDTILRYDPTADSIETMNERLPRGLQSPAATWNGENVYVIGGRYAYKSPSMSARVYGYDPKNDSVVEMSAVLPAGRYAVSAAWDGSNTYVFGGVPETGPLLDEIVRYDPVKDTIELLTVRLPTARGHTAAVWRDAGDECDNLYVIGGVDESGPIDEILAFNSVREKVSLVAFLPTPRSGSSAVWDGNSVFIFGGGLSDTDVLDEIVKLNISLAYSPVVSYEWDFDNRVDSDSDGNKTNDVDAVGPKPNYTYGDNGVFTVTLKVTDERGLWDLDTVNVTALNVPPSIALNTAPSRPEGSLSIFQAHVLDPGSDDLTLIWNWGDGTTDAVTFYNDGMGPDPPKSPWGIFPYNVTHSISHLWGDNGNFTVTFTAMDDDGGVTVEETTAIVNNVAPTIEDIQYYLNASFLFRIAGEKWHDVEIYLYEDGNEIGYADITRYPGSPNDQMVAFGDVSIDFSKTYSAVAYYTPEGDPVNGQTWGATPAWIIVQYDDGEERIHHTFNVRHEDTWMWVIDDFLPYFVGHNITFVGTASDPGSDDLTFTWDWGDGNMTENVHYNDGIGPDPYPSPDVNPIIATDKAKHAYASAGTYTITLTVRDDDGGSAMAILPVTL